MSENNLVIYIGRSLYKPQVYIVKNSYNKLSEMYSSLSGIGNPPLHEPILDGGEGTPEHIIIGSEMTPQTDDKKIDSVPSSLWCSVDKYFLFDHKEIFKLKIM